MSNAKFKVGDKIILDKNAPHYHKNSHFADCLGKFGTIEAINGSYYSIKFNCGETIGRVEDFDLIDCNSKAARLLYAKV